MEKRMKMRFTLLLFAVMLSGATRLSAQESVDVRGISSTMKLEEVIYGHLHELNGKFKLRATEVTFAPGGYLGVHHHAGPGIRYVLSGEVAFTEGGQTTIYKAGDYFFETGNLAHTAENRTNLPLRILFVEILPKDWAGATVVLPRP
jgi:quercetin dioxygenase-like cupin family protein